MEISNKEDTGRSPAPVGYTTNQRDKIKKLNKDQNNGHLRSDEDGKFLEKGKAGGNNPLQAEVDHKQTKKHKTNPATNKFSNAKLLSKNKME